MINRIYVGSSRFLFYTIILFSILGDARKCYSCDTVQDPDKDCNDAGNYKEDECLTTDSSCSKVIQNGSKSDTIR